VANSHIDTLKWRLSWLEQLCQPGPKVILDGIAQPYPGPTAELLQERDQLRRKVRIAELDYMIECTERYAPGAGFGAGGHGPGAAQLRAWHLERDRLIGLCG
jgi:hypothetical protein